MGRTITPVGHPTVNPGDWSAIYEEAYNLAMSGLSGLPPQSAVQFATEIATAAREAYAAAVEGGQAPGIARDAVLKGASTSIQARQTQNGVPPGTGLPAPPGADPALGTVSPIDIQAATDTYREGIKVGTDVRNDILDYVPTPSARGSITPVRTQNLYAAAAPTVQLDTTQSDQMRGQQGVNVADLQAASRGQGSAQDLAAARLQQALRSNAAQASGVVHGARGYARKGAARTAALGANQAGIDAAGKLEELNAATSLQAQGQLASALQGVRGQDITTAAQNATLGQSTGQFNAGQTNTVGMANKDRSLTADTTNNQQALVAWEADEAARVANERLKLDATAAVEASAKGLLDEAGRQETLALAKRSLAVVESKLALEHDAAKRAAMTADRDFWMRAITTLISRAAPAALPGPPAAKHGGLVTKSTLVEVGEAGPELILPVDGVTARLARALALDKKPFDRKGAPDLAALLGLLKSGKSSPKDEERPVPRGLVAILASGNSKARKASY